MSEPPDDDLEGENDGLTEDPDFLGQRKSGTYHVVRSREGEVIFRAADENRLAEKVMRHQEIYNRRRDIRNGVRSVLEKSSWVAARRGTPYIPEMSAQQIADEDRRMYEVFRGKVDHPVSAPFERPFLEDIVMHYEEYSKYVTVKLAHFLLQGDYAQVASLLRESRDVLKGLPMYSENALLYFEAAVSAKMVEILPKAAEENPLLFLKLHDGLVANGLLKVEKEKEVKALAPHFESFLLRCLQKSVSLYTEMVLLLHRRGYIDAREFHESKYVQGPLRRQLIQAMKQSPDWYASLRDWMGLLGLIDPYVVYLDPEIVEATRVHFESWKRQSEVTYEKLRKRWVSKSIREPEHMDQVKVQKTTLFDRLLARSVGGSLKDVDRSSFEDAKFKRLSEEFLLRENEVVEKVAGELERQVRCFFECFPQFAGEEKR